MQPTTLRHMNYEVDLILQLALAPPSSAERSNRV